MLEPLEQIRGLFDYREREGRNVKEPHRSKIIVLTYACLGGEEGV